MPVDDEIWKAALQGEIGRVQKWRNAFWSMLQSEILRCNDIIFQFHPLVQGLMDGFKTFRYVLGVLKKAGYTFMTLTEYVEEVNI
jgi:hypothetical protein